ncbi:MAG: nucleotidyl transferase AbiEii/AbiGii toxin family protein [Polyangiaceae bacterium]
MSRLADALIRIGADLDELGVPWALVGGLAVSARAEPRTTRDVDVAMDVSGDEEAEAIIGALHAKGYKTVALVEQRAVKRLGTMRLRPPSPHRVAPVVDLLFYSSSIEAECTRDAEVLEVLPNVSVPVARAPHLVAMKILARDDRTRPQDLDDILALLDVCTDKDIERTRELLLLIEQRGAHRNRALGAAFEEILAARRV